MIYRRGRTWWGDIYIGGKRVRKSLKTDNRFQALHALRELERAEKGRATDGTGPTFDELAARYLEWAAAQKPASAPLERRYVEIIRAWLYNQGLLTLEVITPLVVERFRVYLQEREVGKGDNKHKHVRSRATINRYTQLLRGMFYRAEDWGLYAGPNPLRKVKFYRESPDVRAYTPDEVKRIGAAVEAVSASAKSPAQRAIADLVRLALNTGLRRSEMTGLRWRDVRDGEVIVHGKGDKRRAVPLNGEAAAVIKRQPRAGEYVFALPNRGQAHIFSRTFRRIAKLAGIPFTFHRLRHTFATNLLAAGVDIITVSSLLGHSKTMTSLLYSHTTPERKREAVDALRSHPSVTAQ